MAEPQPAALSQDDVGSDDLRRPRSDLGRARRPAHESEAAQGLAPLGRECPETPAERRSHVLAHPLLDDELLQEEGIAAGGGNGALDALRSQVGTQATSEGDGVLDGEGRQLRLPEPRLGEDRSGRRGVLVGTERADHRHPPGEEAESPQRGRVRPVHVIEEEGAVDSHSQAHGLGHRLHVGSRCDAGEKPPEREVGVLPHAPEAGCRDDFEAGRYDRLARHRGLADAGVPDHDDRLEPRQRRGNTAYVSLSPHEHLPPPPGPRRGSGRCPSARLRSRDANSCGVRQGPVPTGDPGERQRTRERRRHRVASHPRPNEAPTPRPNTDRAR